MSGHTVFVCLDVHNKTISAARVEQLGEGLHLDTGIVTGAGPRRGRAAANIGRSKGAAFSRLAGRTTVPIFVLVRQVTVAKRLDVDGAARKWITALPQLVLRAWPNEDPRHARS